MRASRLAYDEVPKSRRVTRVIARPSTDAHVVVMDDGVVAFRGTHSTRALLNVARVTSTRPPQRLAVREDTCLIHTGVFQMFESVEQDISVAIASLPKITFVGHSLGGCVASLAAAYFGSIGPVDRSISCHTFGSPKCGDLAFYNWRDRRVAQALDVVAAADPVPRVWLGCGCGRPGLREQDVLVVTPYQNPLRAHNTDTYMRVAHFLATLEKKQLLLAPQAP
jgi:pimeloyl-ACP methyl ester carboxylesterase